MKALTVQQPWAWALFHGKRIENRTQMWSYRGPLAIHAGQRLSDRGMGDQRIHRAVRHWQRGVVAQGGATPLLRDALEFGVVLGVVDLVDVHPEAGCCAPWGESSYVEHGGRERRRIVHLVLEEPRLLPEPIPCKGLLGLWTPPADITEQLEELRQ